MRKVSIILAAYNEDKLIKEIILELVQGFKKINYEIIISADGCTDKTYEIVEKLIEKNKRIILLKSKKRLGKGGGLKKGFQKSVGEIIVFADADGSSESKDIIKLISKLDKFDVAIGSRELIKSKVKSTVLRRFLGRGFIFGVNLLLNLHIKDTQCGYKAFKKKVLSATFHKVKSSGWEFDVELLWWIKKMGFSIKEVPINWVHRNQAKIKFIDIFKMAWGVVKIRFRI